MVFPNGFKITVRLEQYDDGEILEVSETTTETSDQTYDVIAELIRRTGRAAQHASFWYDRDEDWPE